MEGASTELVLLLKYLGLKYLFGNLPRFSDRALHFKTVSLFYHGTIHNLMLSFQIRSAMREKARQRPKTNAGKAKEKKL